LSLLIAIGSNIKTCISDAFEMNTIEKAINEFHKNTCIRFLKRQSQFDYISIENGASGCWSSVGKVGGKQVVNLQSPGCVRKVGTPIHELMHAIGIIHQQNRDDRDRFVTIKKNNIRQGYEANFDKAKSGETSAYNIRYSYGSVMHYSATAFSKNGQPTIEAKSATSEVMGQREGFAKTDIALINKMYKCPSSSDSQPDEASTTTGKPFYGIFEALFPSSSMDEEEYQEE